MKKCTCKIPKPKSKVSENGTLFYCANCSKDYVFNFDHDENFYRETFTNFEVPFTERIEKAVQFANDRIAEKAKFRSRFELFLNTGSIFVESTNISY
jgi:hypothetical protein